ncbi:MAG: DUF1592 domain-containing protein [Phycisphaerales bacterium]
MLAVSVVVFCGVARAQVEGPGTGVDALAQQLEQRLAEDVAPILEQFCYKCHGPTKAKQGIRFDRLQTIRDILEMGDELAIARELIETGEMPPEDEPSPTEHQRLVATQWLDDALAYYPQDAELDPGWFTIHRLNRTEYRLTMRDLLGVDRADVDLAAGLPDDDIGYGFDNIADVLTFSPLHMERYLDAAERAIELGLGPEIQPDAPPRMLRLVERPRHGAELPGGGFMLYSNGAVGARTSVPIDAEYEITVSAWGTPGGDEPPRLSLRVDDREVAAFWVEARQGEPGVYRVRVRLPAGTSLIRAHFTNDFYQPNVADRNLAVTGIELRGPVDAATIKRPAGWDMVMTASPAAEGESEAARRVITGFALRAFRRPPHEDEIEALLELYARSRQEGQTWESSVRLALTAVLVSPKFLYRFVENPFADVPEYVYELNAFELASRLSYFLWSSMPDGQLMQLAQTGALLSDETLRAQVRRMLSDPKSNAFIENFAGQWLQLRNLADLAMDRAKFPEFDDDLRRSMIAEATLFVADVVRNDRSVYDLIDSRDTFVDERLARLYGLSGVSGRGFQRVSLPEDSPRGGVLTMGAVLTVTSNPTRTSPVKRGLFVLDEILGAPPPPPPPDIPPLEQSGGASAQPLTLREQLSLHLSDAVCASCHRRMDPIGLAMENFNAIGQWRQTDQGVEIDATGQLPGGVAFSGPRELKGVLLARRGQFVENLTRKLMTYALGRGMEPFDRPTIYRIARQAEAEGATFSSIIEQIVLSHTFRTCRGRRHDD